MGTIHLIGGEKGGVGKSVVARLLAQYFIDHKLDFAAFDGDASHGALLRYYAASSQPVQVDAFESMDRIVESALDGERRVLVDLPAQCRRQLFEWIESADVLELSRDKSAPIRLWHVTDGGYDSVQLLGSLGERYGKDASYIVVRNHGRAGDFSQLDESPQLIEARALGAEVIDLPQLHSAAMYQLDRHSSSFWAAVNDEASTFRLSPMDRRRARKWLKESYEQLDQVAPLL